MVRRDAEAAFDDDVIGSGTLPRLFEESAARNADRVAQRYKGGVRERSLVDRGVVPAAPDGAFADRTYAEMRDLVRRFAAGFRALGVAPGDRVGVYAHTRMEWAQVDFAVLAAGGAVATLYPNASERRVRRLLADAAATGVVVEDADALERVLAVEADLDVDLEFVVVVDALDAGAAVARDRADVLTLGDLYRRGADAFDPVAYESWLDARDPEDLASVVYTSGTTGDPKGVELTHRNFRSNLNRTYRRFGPRPDRDGPAIGPEATTLSYLPLAHVFERLAGHFLMFGAGATVGYAEAPDTLREDFRLVRPTVATSVPRVYERLYEAVRAEAASSPVRERLFRWAADVARRYGRTDDPDPLLAAGRAVADRLVYGKVRAALGGRVGFLISGGGSLSADLCALYHGMGLPVLEGYGLTETAPVVSANPPEAPEVGTVGPPLGGVSVRVDPDGAAGLDPEYGGEVGELHVDGPNVFRGYRGMPAATEAAFTDDGWFRTGDVVEVRPDGYLVFRERARQVLALSTGKMVPPGPLEDAFAAEPLVEQCMVVGDGRRFVGALVVPNADEVRARAAREGVELPADDRALCDDERVREWFRSTVARLNDRFEPHERIKRFELVAEPFTEENGLLTPTMKKRRREIRASHEPALTALYEEAE